jgi:hypothetical protein
MYGLRMLTARNAEIGLQHIPWPPFLKLEIIVHELPAAG